MRLLKLTAILLSLSLFSACSKEDASPKSDYIVFGAFSYGFGDFGKFDEHRFKTYKLDNVQHQLYEDTTRTPPFLHEQGKYVLRSQASYDQVQGLSDKIPASLLAMPDGDVNINAVADAYTYYVEIQQDGQKRYWYMDSYKENVPSSLHAFHIEVKERINLLR
ncbi:hypothetical protein MUN82_00330 [Hymenobacter aerilatus]|uniref:DUF4136 domain-containing protein n=1 Tax=Hymenobacter aerilatus TaxID=2932251 RepID=A0A8T9SVY5_9BACT|nr:hypothetical protein [Hymenobacter aerilatus]UOR05561.1 hypothetical protein MUN82_00330 [Hymenobacter aerilatus]